MISIIIPTLNEESVIEDRLRRLKSTLTIPHEIIVTDGKSSDRTVEIARKYADKVVAYDGVTRQTIAQGRNDGARVAVGDLLIFLDADCVIPNPDTEILRAIAKFDDPKVVALVPWIKVMKEYETWSDYIVYACFNTYLLFINNILNLGVSGGEFQMMRMEDFRKVGGYNEKLVASEDVELLSRLKKLGRIRMDKNLVIYHTGRRAHKIGWPRLLTQWFLNAFFMTVLGRAFHKEWKVIR
ncbi:MAG: glycosyltransferase [Candidatus Paceibacterota bacterium]